jgi:glutamine---fructose-6-phosphate transaminase (isomerizing)
MREHGEITTLREIYGQPDAWRTALRFLGKADLQEFAGDRNPLEFEWLFVGCGTSYYLAQASAATFTALLGVRAHAVPASELLLYPQLVLPSAGKNAFPVLISRSGRTSEVLQVAEYLQQQQIEFLVLTCDGNELTATSRRVLQLPVHESSTVMTSSFTSMLMSMQYLAAWFAGRSDILETLDSLPAHLERLLPEYGPQVMALAERSFEDFAFLGQGPFYPIAAETALKVMESSSSYAQYFHTLEFRHGPKSIVSRKTLIGALISQAGQTEETAVLNEMKELGGATLAVTNTATPALRDAADLLIELNLPSPEIVWLPLYIVWGQLFGSYYGLAKGLNPDQPRHLSRVVVL